MAAYDPARARPVPGVTYNFCGMIAEVLFEDVMYVGQYVSPELTILRERKTNRVVGCIVGLPKIDGAA